FAFPSRTVKKIDSLSLAKRGRAHNVTVAVPAAMIAIAPTTAAVLSFVHAISFSVDLMRVKVEAVTVVPLTAATVTEVASPIGAAWTEFAETAPAITAVESVSPCLQIPSKPHRL